MGVKSRMEYGDEQLVELLYAYKKGTYGSLQKGYFIQGDLYHFKETEILGGHAFAMLPIRFSELTQDELDKTLRMDGIIEDVRASSNRAIQLKFTLSEMPFSGDYEKSVSYIVEQIKQIQPAYRIEKINCEQNVLTGPWIEFQSSAIDRQLYNMNFYINMGNQLLQGLFICPIGWKENWKIVFQEMFRSIKEMA